jgi:hypothetical protein
MRLAHFPTRVVDHPQVMIMHSRTLLTGPLASEGRRPGCGMA